MKTIIILDKQNDFEQIIGNLEKYKNIKIISIDNISHKSLTKNKIDHISGDSLLNQEDRLKIYDKSISYLNWYENISNEKFIFYGYNLLEIVDSNEFQMLLSEKLTKLFCIKNILDLEKPDKIITTSSSLKIINCINDKIITELISEEKIEDELFFDVIEINFDEKIFPRKIKLSRKNYQLIKNNIENLICKIYGLSYKENKRKSILFVEFNPESYEELFNEINKCGKQSVLLNSRRSALWSKNSIQILKKTNCKIITYNQFLTKENKKIILKNTIKFKKEFLNEIENKSKMEKIFSINDISFWNLIKKQILDIYITRIKERLTYILISEKISNNKDFECVVSLNLSGETERIFSNNKNIISVLLQHAFGNYSKQIKSLEITDDLHLIKDKIAVWGEIMKSYLMDNYKLPEEKIIVVGSPRHDSFFKNKLNNENKNMILLTPRPIIRDIEGENSDKHDLYEKTLKKILKCAEKNDLKLMVKLHPQRNEHNDVIIEIIKKYDSEIKIFQNTPILNLLKKCSLMVNLSPDSYDASTTILEAMIMEKPVIDITLASKRYEFEFLKDKAICDLNSSDNIEKFMVELSSKTNTRNELIEKSQIHLNRYLSNQGNGSKTLAQKLVDMK